MASEKDYMEMTRQERAQLIVNDSEAYMDIVPKDHWLLVLDGMAKLPPVTDEPD